MSPLIRISLCLILIVAVLWGAVTLHSEVAALSLPVLGRSWDLLMLAGALSLLNYALRAIRWRWYLTRLGYPLPAGFAWLTYFAGFAFTLSPAKLGEVARAGYYTSRGIPIGKAVAGFCAERLLDVLAMLILATGVIALFPRYANVLGLAALLVVAIAGGLLLFPEILRRWGVASHDGTSGLRRRLARLGTMVATTAQSARPLLTPDAVAIGLPLGLGAWALEALGLYALSFMFPEVHLTLQAAIGIYAIAILAGAVALLPGGLGGTEAVMTTLLVSQGFTLAQALLITLTCRLMTLWLAVGLGWGAILILRMRRPAPEWVA